MLSGASLEFVQFKKPVNGNTDPRKKKHKYLKYQ